MLKTYKRTDLINLTAALNKLDRSLKSAEDFAELTSDCHGIIEAKRQNINELKDILTLIAWTYGEANTHIKFTKKRKFLDNFLKLTDVLDSKYEHWNKRVHVFLYQKNDKHAVLVYVFY